MMISDQITRNYFNNLANDWTNKHPQNEDREKIKRLLNKLCLDKAQRILDIGCGTGVLFPYLANLCNGDTRIIAIDYAPSMAKLAQKNSNGKIRLVCGDVQSLSFIKDSFDKIIAFHVFPHIHDKINALHECWRILKSEGELAIIHLGGSREINQLHTEIGGIVAEHTLPSGNELKRLLMISHYEIKEMIDQPELYFVRAIKLTS